MKPTELRIGNLVTQIIERSTHNEEKTITIEWQELMWISRDRVDFYKPIPLTEEWLLKFWFEKSIVKEPWFEKNKIEVFKYSKGNFFLLGGNHTAYGIGLHDIWKGMEINIQYVHQLQNLYFALTNEQLTLIK